MIVLTGRGCRRAGGVAALSQPLRQVGAVRDTAPARPSPDRYRPLFVVGIFVGFFVVTFLLGFALVRLLPQRPRPLLRHFAFPSP
jgi:hypothetical protein